MLRDLNLKPSYRSDRDDIASDFIERVLSNADYYDRAAGYFTSSVLSYIAVGLHAFLARGGLMRLVASPHLSPQDVEAIRQGYASSDATIVASLEATIAEMELSPGSYSTQMLTWLIANKRLALKIAVPTVSYGIFHEKIGIVRDSVDAVAFTGSANETAAAFGQNFESIEVFLSWADPKRVGQKIQDFEDLWYNRTAQLRVIEFPAALAARLIRLAPHEPPSHPEATRKEASLPLRDYQEDAVKAWNANDHRGIFAMATGTGKTKTAISAARESARDGVKTIVVLAPLKHLVEQWADELREYFGHEPIKCFSDYDWHSQLITEASGVKLGLGQRPLILVATYATAQSSEFMVQLWRFPQPALLIADEVHNITRKSADGVLSAIYARRLGLSATPERHEDAVGTRLILDYFDGIVFEYSISDAIRAGYLVPYDYHPVFCNFTDKEAVEYEALKTAMAEVRQASDEGTRGSRLRAILRLRARLIQRAADKIRKFEDLVDNGSFSDTGYNLVYTHPGFLPIIQDFLGKDRHLRVHTFTAREPVQERRQILERFAQKKLDYLTAIRCLDEGVDVPPTRTAFLLNSSTNPKEFIQRRGRILRPWPGKTSATIYDFIVLPKHVGEDAIYVQREIDRFYAFASVAQNRNTAMRLLEDQADRIGLALSRSLQPMRGINAENSDEARVRADQFAGI